jgi:hypothetical protein
MAPAQSARPRTDILRFTSHRHLRQRILLSILSGKSIRVDAIRSDDVQVGLRDYEINLLRLVEKITNGSTIEISVTGECSCHGEADPCSPVQVLPSCYILDSCPEGHTVTPVTSAGQWDTTSSC